MRRWLIAGAVLAVLATLGVLLLVNARQRPRRDGLVDDFHTVERQCLATFIAALHRQSANQIDERMFAEIIDHDVLPPWHAFRLRVDTAPDSPLVTAMRRYFADRETAWRAFVVALSAPGEDPSALATYHQKNADADDDARALARLLPR